MVSLLKLLSPVLIAVLPCCAVYCANAGVDPAIALPSPSCCALISNPFCRLRKIYIAERLSLEPADGPKDAQAAAIMGNSRSAWLKHYDPNASLRDTQAAADSSVMWRQAMLQRGMQKAIALHENELLENGV